MDERRLSENNLCGARRAGAEQQPFLSDTNWVAIGAVDCCCCYCIQSHIFIDPDQLPHKSIVYHQLPDVKMRYTDLDPLRIVDERCEYDNAEH